MPRFLPLFPPTAELIEVKETMKLSMAILMQNFVQKNLKFSADIMKGDQVLSGVRLLPAAVGDDAIAAVVPGSAAGQAGGSAIISGSDRIFLPEHSPEDTLNLVTDIFDLYNRWERELYVILASGGSLQELLDCAHRMFSRPMFIKSSSGHIKAITYGYPCSTHPLWDRFELSARTGTVERESSVFVSSDPEYSAVFSQRKAAVVRSPLYGGMVLRVNTWQNEQWVYEVVAFANGKPFDTSDIHLMDTFLEVMNCYVKANAERYRSFSDLSEFFRELLRTGHSGNANFLLIYNGMGWAPEDELVTVSVSSITGQDTPALGMLRERLSQEMHSMVVLQSEGGLECIADIKLYGGYRETIERLSQIIPQDIFTWGISYEFSGLERIPRFMSYAAKAQAEAKSAGKPYLTMYDAACSWIAAHLKESGRNADLIHPGVVKLIERDGNSSSKLSSTLFEYLLCGGNFTDTALHLGIHRNSLIYRISKIQEIVGSDLNSPAKRKLMLYSFILLGY